MRTELEWPNHTPKWAQNTCAVTPVGAGSLLEDKPHLPATLDPCWAHRGCMHSPEQPKTGQNTWPGVEPRVCVYTWAILTGESHLKCGRHSDPLLLRQPIGKVSVRGVGSALGATLCAVWPEHRHSSVSHAVWRDQFGPTGANYGRTTNKTHVALVHPFCGDATGSRPCRPQSGKVKVLVISGHFPPVLGSGQAKIWPNRTDERPNANIKHVNFFSHFGRL